MVKEDEYHNENRLVYIMANYAIPWKSLASTIDVTIFWEKVETIDVVIFYGALCAMCA